MIQDEISMASLKERGRHYVLKARYDAQRDNYHVQPAKNKFKNFGRDWPEGFALVVWFSIEGQEQFFAVPYAAIQHLFRGIPNRGGCWDVHIVRGRLYAGSESLGVVNVSSCRWDQENPRLLVIASLRGDESTVRDILAKLAVSCM
jgi:hypothetical protein